MATDGDAESVSLVGRRERVCHRVGVGAPRSANVVRQRGEERIRFLPIPVLQRVRQCAATFDGGSTLLRAPAVLDAP